ncbi:MAG: long-chain fatty acid--CoA ligase [Actinomycetota bacterium]
MQRTTERVGVRSDLGSVGSLPEALSLSVEARGGRTALASKVGSRWVEISYERLWERVGDFAAGLYHLGVRRGSRVGLICRNRPEWPVVDFAVQSLGAATVPVYPTLEEEQVRHILRDCGAVAVIVEDEDLLGKVSGVRDGLPELRHLVLIGSPEDERLHASEVEESLPRLPHAAVEESGGEAVLRMAEVEAKGRVEPLAGWEEGWRSLGRDDVATIIYTSGTTGAPKGVMLTHGNFLSNVEGVLRALPFRGEDIFLSFLPLSHVFERCGHYLALALGTKIFYAESVEKVPENLREVRPTVMLSVPRLYEKMYDRVLQRVESGSALRRRLFHAAIAAGRKRYELERTGRPVGRALKMRLALYDRLVFKKLREAVGGRLRFFVAGGAKLEKEIGEFFYAAGVVIIEGYGLTETSPVIACNRLPVPRFGTVGLPLDNVEVRVAPEDGEVQVRGPSVMRGYFENEEATREAFTSDGWFRTGDMGELDDEGYLSITDRLKNLIVLSTGKNVAPAPIEAAIVSAPHVAQVVLLGDGKKYVSALVVPDYDAVRTALRTEASNEELAGDELCLKLIEREVAEACARFADYERPKKVALLARELTHETGELTPTLKVKLRVVRERYRDKIESLYA